MTNDYDDRRDFSKTPEPESVISGRTIAQVTQDEGDEDGGKDAGA